VVLWLECTVRALLHVLAADAPCRRIGTSVRPRSVQCRPAARAVVALVGLCSQINIGYESFHNTQLLRVNGQEVRNMKK
jgi:hypothetical protein